MQNESELNLYFHCMPQFHSCITLKTLSKLSIRFQRCIHFSDAQNIKNTKEIEYFYWFCIKINFSEFRLILPDHITNAVTNDIHSNVPSSYVLMFLSCFYPILIQTSAIIMLVAYQWEYKIEIDARSLVQSRFWVKPNLIGSDRVILNLVTRGKSPLVVAHSNGYISKICHKITPNEWPESLATGIKL